MTRLNYETKAGNFSEAETFQQLEEYVTKAQECCYALGHYRKANDDFVSGQGFLAYGEIFKKAEDTLRKLFTLHPQKLM